MSKDSGAEQQLIIPGLEPEVPIPDVPLNQQTTDPVDELRRANQEILESLGREGAQVHPTLFLKIRLDILSNLLVGETLLPLFNGLYETQLNEELRNVQREVTRVKLTQGVK